MTRILVPFRSSDPKTRLAPVLKPSERTALATCLRRDVCRAIRAAGYEPTLLSTESTDADPEIVDDRELSAAVNAHLDPPTAVIMADLGLATPDAITRLLETPGDVVIAPGRGGGTNAIVIRDDTFTVDYHGGSLLDHRRNCDTLDLSLSVVDSYRLATDIDTPADLPELLMHASNEAATWLSDRFTLDTSASRVELRRQ